MLTPTTRTDRVFHALSHATRRAVVERLGRGSASVSELAAPFSTSLPTFVSHLRVLERSGVVRSRKRGRVRTYELAPDAFEAVEGWLATQRRVWERRLDQLDAYLLTLKESEP